MTKFGHLAYKVLGGWDGAQKRAAATGPASNVFTNVSTSQLPSTAGGTRLIGKDAPTVQSTPPPPSGAVKTDSTAKTVTGNANNQVKMPPAKVTPYAGLNAIRTPGMKA